MITFRNTTENYVGKGSRLTITEGDENIWELLSRIVALEDAGIAAQIDHFDVDINGQFTVTLTDYTVLGPYQLPVATFNPRGEWQTNTQYGVNDLVVASASLYLVIYSHTSDPDAFDEFDNDGQGHDFYRFVMKLDKWTVKGTWTADTQFTAQDVVSYGGSLYLVLISHLSDSTFDPDRLEGGNPVYQLIISAPIFNGRGAWQVDTNYNAMDTVTANGKIYLVLIDHTSDSYTFDPNAVDESSNPLYSLISKIPAIPINEKTSSTFTPTIDDANTVMMMTNGNGCDITMPPHSEVPFEINDELHYRQSDLGPLTFSYDSPVEIDPVEGRLYSTNKVGALVGFKQYAIDKWIMFGMLELMPEEEGVS